MGLKYFILILTSLLLFACSTKKERIINLGYNLIDLKNTDSISLSNPNYAISDAENIGPGLFKNLKECHFDKSGVSMSVLNGDAHYPIGDGKATNLLKIYDHNNSITIRLRYDKALDLYQILGYY